MKRFLIPNSNHINEPPESSKKISIEKNDSVTINDLSENADQKPVQPILRLFPRHNISNKNRSFNESWYAKRPWIEYSVILDKIFCFYCRHFALNVNYISKQDAYISLGYCDWKNIGNTTNKHECSNIHKISLEKYHAYIKSKSDGAVSSQCSNYAKKQIIKNREVLTSMIRIVLFCARQDIGLRGHRNEKLQIQNINKSQVLSSNCNEIELNLSQNQGNFMELVKVLCLENKSFESNLMSLPMNGKYVSNTIQNDILEAAANVVGRNIVDEIKRGSDVYSIIADEARDISNQELMSICVRYIFGSKIKERFLGFVLIQDLDANSLSKTICEFLKNINIDITKCVGQSYDGASVMSGSNNGVQVKIRELSQNPCPYVHCYAHRLNLVLIDSAKTVSALDDLIGLLEAIYAFQSTSTIRHEAFIKSQEKYNNIMQLPQHCQTRWVSKYKGVHFFKNRFDCVINALKICSSSNKKKEAAEAKGLLHQFCVFDIILMLFYMDDILGTINHLSIYLQNSSLDILKCLKLVKSTTLQLTSMRTEKEFNKFYEQALVAAKVANIKTPDIINDLNESRKSNLPKKFNNSHVLIKFEYNKNKGENTSTNFKINTYKQQYYEIIDTIINEMANRFNKNDDLLTAIDACDPNSENFMNTEQIQYLGELYIKDPTTIEQIISQSKLVRSMMKKSLDITDVHNELTKLEPAFNAIKQLITNIMVIPISSAAAERSFSALRRIKTYLRSTMTTERLHNAAILSIEREMSSQLLNDPNTIIDEFAKSKNRRLTFTL